ncbi:TrpB-like pyridoxal phosphate-dependent enzyme, partial [Thermodesulfovibrionales bacterium]|nr:TrpB-like pyridoxal phosphate-dependent enzyme [Thermodesulfovibrionales bacterium]
ELQQILHLWRPTPLYRAHRLEKALDTPAKIFYKYEGVSPVGSHKLNTAIVQAYYARQDGIKRLATETGAGQWGSALAMGCSFIGLECKVYMVRVSYNQKPYRRILMETFRATCIPSPSSDTQAGRDILSTDPDSSGSLGMAISEAVEDAMNRDDTYYALGSVLNHVLMHQTLIGLEVKKQIEKTGNYPNILVGCVGGGSNFAGTLLPFIPDKLKGREIQIIAVEPEACPTLTKGPDLYDFGDVAGLTPLMKMFTLGHTFVPPPVHAGGLRYHGMAPIICHLRRLGLIEARAEHQRSIFQSAEQFARAEGIVPAPESAHAIKVIIDEALKCKESGETKTILLALSGHGHFDLASYDAYLSNKLTDYEYPHEKVEEALAKVPKV